MKKIRNYMLLLCVVLLAVGCEAKEKEADTEYHRYYINGEENALVSDGYVPTTRTTQSMVEEMVKLLQEEVTSDNHKTLLPPEVKILDYKFESKNVVINFSQTYKEMNHIREILVRSGFTKSFTQIPGVLSITFQLEGEPMMNSKGEVLGRMNADTFVENEGRNINSYLYTPLNLYFTNEAGDALIKERVKVYYSSNVPLEKVVVQQLLRGPRISGDYPTVPSEVGILGVSISEGIAYVNLDKNFLDQTLTVQEEIPIYSIVNSLVDACKVSKVQISVNGETKVTFRESMSLDKFYEKESRLIKEKTND